MQQAATKRSENRERSATETRRVESQNAGMIHVIGTDAGAPATLTPPQQTLVREASCLAAPLRLHPALQAWLGAHPARLISSDDPRALCEELSQALEPSWVVLASGDPLWFGIGRILLDRLGREQLCFHPAPSSMQLAFAKIGRPWQDASWISLHGRDPGQLHRALQQRPSALAVLTDPDQGGAETVRRSLLSSGLAASYQFWILEQLGHPQERVHRPPLDEPLPLDLPRLLLVLLIADTPEELPACSLPLFGLDDGLFLQHPDHPGLMTKREVRVQLLADLQLPSHGVLWDLGAGTGSVGLEALRIRPELLLLAVERRGGGASVIQANAKRLGVQPAAILECDARMLSTIALDDALQKPDRVVLGGGGRHRTSLLQFVLSRLKPGGVVVIPMATIEAVSELRPLLEEAEMRVSLNQLQAWRGQMLGDGTRLAPMNPAWILCGTKTNQD